MYNVSRIIVLFIISRMFPAAHKNLQLKPSQLEQLWITAEKYHNKLF
jgi:hypothetical protein